MNIAAYWRVFQGVGGAGWQVAIGIIYLGNLVGIALHVYFFMGFWKYKKTPINERNSTHRQRLTDNWKSGYIIELAAGLFGLLGIGYATITVGDASKGYNYKDLQGRD